MKVNRIFLDTSFWIRLFDPTEKDHEQARAYFEYFLVHSDMIYLSTVVAAEYGIGGDINDLPYDAPKVRVVPFSLRHARKAAECAKFAYEQKRKGAVTLEKRIVIPNDTKILAQAEVEGTDWFVARDNNCRTVHEMLKNGGLLRFNYLDFRTPVGEFVGELF
jgi:predicted nucleic acid-binding protein